MLQGIVAVDDVGVGAVAVGAVIGHDVAQRRSAGRQRAIKLRVVALGVEQQGIARLEAGDDPALQSGFHLAAHRVEVFVDVVEALRDADDRDDAAAALEAVPAGDAAALDFLSLAGVDDDRRQLGLIDRHEPAAVDPGPGSGAIGGRTRLLALGRRGREVRAQSCDECAPDLGAGMGHGIKQQTPAPVARG